MKTKKERLEYHKKRMRIWRRSKGIPERTLNKKPKPKKQTNPFTKHKCCICKSQAKGIISKKYFCNKCYNNNNYNKMHRKKLKGGKKK